VGEQEGMQTFDGDIERLIRNGTLDMETGLAYATNPGNLQLDMSDLKLEAEAEVEADPLLETS
jgi:twitching motility protein PilT